MNRNRPEIVHTKIQQAFNILLQEFVKNLVPTFPEYATIIETSYNDYMFHQETNDLFISWFERATKPYLLELTMKNDDLFMKNKELFLFPNINFCVLWKSNITCDTRKNLWKYLHIFLELLAWYQNPDNIPTAFLPRTQEKETMMDSILINIFGPDERSGCVVL